MFSTSYIHGGLAKECSILGNFFRSKSYQKNNAELMVLCTVHRVAPSTTTPAIPTGPTPMLDKEKFDKTQPGGDKK